MKMNNSVELIGFYGSDEAIACAAWTSTNRELTDEKRGRIGKLIKSLWQASHETPTERGIVHFLVNSEIASHIHILKHRIAGVNAESPRYKEVKEDKFYIPEDWEGIYCEKRFSDYLLECHGIRSVKWSEILEDYTMLGNELYHKCLEDLTPILGRQRAKESSRFFKTYNSQIQSDVIFNLRSFANFLKLRNSEHAQKEIREIAAEMERLVRAIPGDPFKNAMEIIVRKNKVMQKINDLPIEEVEKLLGIQ